MAGHIMPNAPTILTIDILKAEAVRFAAEECAHDEPTLFGVTDGKAVGTYLEQKFRSYVIPRYTSLDGNSAKGIDFPGLNVDIKVTSIKQPQSSCPFKSARQKVYGLGYSLLVFVYEKSDEPKLRTARLNIRHTLFVDSAATADFSTTKRLREMLKDGANQEDLVAYFGDRNLPLDDIQANALAEEVMQRVPEQGYLTISNALQWRLQYQRLITVAGSVDGVFDLRDAS